MSSPIDVVMERLGGGKATSKGFTARCPSHPDKRASLSISTGKDGRAILHCHAGCAPEAIVQALGLTMADLFNGNGNGPIVLPFPKGRSKRNQSQRASGSSTGVSGNGSSRTKSAEWTYVDELGAPLYRAVRWALEDGGKSFTLEAPDGSPSIQGIRRVPLHLDKLTKADRGSLVVVVEGEKTADAATGLGFLATSSPCGAGKWNGLDPAALEAFRGQHVCVLPDLDEPGARHAEQVATSLQGIAASIKIVSLPGLQEPGDDLVDWIEAHDGHDTEEIRGELVSLIEAAAPWKATKATLFPFLSLAELEALPSPRWLIEDILPEASLAVIYGPAGHGKSFVALDMALCLAAGLQWHGQILRQGRVAYALGEGGGSFKYRVQAWALGRNGEQFSRCTDTFKLCPAVPYLVQAENLGEFLNALKALDPQPKLVVLDTLARCLLGADENSAKDMGAAVEAMDAIRRVTGASVLALHHVPKDKERGGPRGSTALAGGADVLIACTADPAQNVTLKIEKQKDGERHAPILLKLEPVSLGTDADGRPITSCRVRKLSAFEEAQELNKVSREFLELLLKHAEGLTKTDIMGVSNVSNATFYRGMNPLTESQAVSRKGARYFAR